MSKLKYHAHDDGGMWVALSTYLRRQSPLQNVPVGLLNARETTWLNRVFQDSGAVDFMVANTPAVIVNDHPRWKLHHDTSLSINDPRNHVKNTWDRWLYVPPQEVMLFRMRFDPVLERDD